MADFFSGMAQGLTQGAQLGMSKRRMEEQRRARQQQLELQQQQLRQEQQQFQQQHSLEREKFDFQKVLQESQQQTQERLAQIQERQADLETWGSMLKLFEPGVPKGFQKLGLKQLGKQLGIDPQHPEFKDMLQALGSLNPEEVETMTTAISTFMENAEPGQGRALAKAILSGQISMADLLTQLGSLQERRIEQQGLEQEQQTQQQLLERLEGDGGGDVQSETEALNLFGPGGRAIARFRQEVDPELREQRAFAEEEGKRRSAARSPVPSSVKSLLGFEGEFTKAEAQELGIHTDLLDPPTIRQSLQTKSQVKGTIKSIDQLANMVEGRPELLGAPGALVRGLNNVMATISGLTELIPGGSLLNKGLDEISQMDEVQRMVDENLSGQSAAIRSRVVSLAYQLVNAQKSGRLSNQDIERSMIQLGQSADPNQFVTVLRDLEEQVRRSGSEEIAGLTGFPPIDLMTDQEIVEMSETVDDPRILKSLFDEMRKRD